MTKRERAMKDRMWLRIHKFSTTQSLQDRLASSNLSLQEHEWCCYIQNKVLMCLRQFDTASIHSKYFKDKIGQDYAKYLRLLRSWDELDSDDFFIQPGAFTDGKPKTYSIPQAALDTGIVIRDFKAGKIKATKDRSVCPPDQPWLSFILSNLKELSCSKTLVQSADAVTNALIYDYAKRIFHKDFDVHVGRTSKRLFHSVIQMPKEGRANLVWRNNDQPLEVEYDIKSCHSVLLLTLATDEVEKKNYKRVLDHDIYDVIRVKGDIIDTREGCKLEWSIFVNNPQKSHTRCKNNYVYQFYKEHFPLLTEAILRHQETAVSLQNLEASIMVEQAGKFCMDAKIWFVPMHDGFLCKPENFDGVAAFVAKAFYKATGYAVMIDYKKLGNSTLSTPYHMWGYKTPDAVWKQRLEDYNKRHPAEELEKACAERQLKRADKIYWIQQEEEAEELWREVSKIHRNTKQ